MLAPLTNKQSNEDGTLTDAEFHWLTMRAKGQFGLVMTCASHVQQIGKGFEGQLGIFSDIQNEGHKKLAKSIIEKGSLAVIQLHHAGMRTPQELIDEQPVCPSTNTKHNARALTLKEVEALRDAFVTAAVRAQKCGYNGVELHGAHGYIISQFLSAQINQRKDKYGGSLHNRARLLFEIVNKIRTQCGANFLIGVRLSPEKFGMDLQEIKDISQQLIDENKIDFLDISLWDCFKMPEEPQYQNKPLLQHFTDLDWKKVKLTVAGKIRNGKDVVNILQHNVDFVSVGRSAILHHDFPKQVMLNPAFQAIETPVSKEHLKKEGLSDTFISYMGKWPGFVQ